MSLLVGRGAIGFVLLAFWIWAIFDVISSDDALIRNLPKGVWLMVVIFLSDIGAIAWLLMGRPANAGWRPGDSTVRPVKRTYGPEDQPRWDPRLDAREGAQETYRERQDRERRERYESLDAELDKRLAEKVEEERRLAEWEEQLRLREDDLRRREASGES